MPRFTLKDGTFEAVRWDGDAATALRYLGRRGVLWRWARTDDGDIEVAAWYGWDRVEVGSYIVFGPGDATVLPCETFDKLFRLVEDDPAK